MVGRRGPGRPADHDIDTSQALLEAARLRFAAQGFEATSLREIASDANVDVALISYRFGGKAGLWKTVISQAAASLNDALSQAGQEAASQGLAVLRHSMIAFVDHLLAHPDIPRLLLRDLTVDTERSEWLLSELSMPLHDRFFALAHAGMGNSAGQPSHLKFRIANFIYAAASSVARRERLTRLVDGIADDHGFRAALEVTLVDGTLRHD